MVCRLADQGPRTAGDQGRAALPPKAGAAAECPSRWQRTQCPSTRTEHRRPRHSSSCGEPNRRSENSPHAPGIGTPGTRAATRLRARSTTRCYTLFPGKYGHAIGETRFMDTTTNMVPARQSSSGILRLSRAPSQAGELVISDCHCTLVTELQSLKIMSPARMSSTAELELHGVCALWHAEEHGIPAGQTHTPLAGQELETAMPATHSRCELELECLEQAAPAVQQVVSATPGRELNQHVHDSALVLAGLGQSVKEPLKVLQPSLYSDRTVFVCQAGVEPMYEAPEHHGGYRWRNKSVTVDVDDAFQALVDDMFHGSSTLSESVLCVGGRVFANNPRRGQLEVWFKPGTPEEDARVHVKKLTKIESAWFRHRHLDSLMKREEDMSNSHWELCIGTPEERVRRAYLMVRSIIAAFEHRELRQLRSMYKQLKLNGKLIDLVRACGSRVPPPGANIPAAELIHQSPDGNRHTEAVLYVKKLQASLQVLAHAVHDRVWAGKGQMQHWQSVFQDMNLLAAEAQRRMSEVTAGDMYKEPKLDLHWHDTELALRHTRQFLAHWRWIAMSENRPQELQIITGKGGHTNGCGAAFKLKQLRAKRRNRADAACLVQLVALNVCQEFGCPGVIDERNRGLVLVCMRPQDVA